MFVKYLLNICYSYIVATLVHLLSKIYSSKKYSCNRVFLNIFFYISYTHYSSYMKFLKGSFWNELQGISFVSKVSDSTRGQAIQSVLLQ